jgi:NhaP-type Na+/H+ or K+/H+ antiporter
VSWAPIGLKRVPISLAMLCVGLGVLLFSSGLLKFQPDPRTWDTVTERLVELVVIVSLMGAGLKLDRPVSWRGWSSTWRLLAIAMPLTILATLALGVWGLGITYALTEVVHGYGFLAVFVCGLTIRAWERNHDFHDEMHHFAELTERLLMMLVLVLFGGALAQGLLSALTWWDMAIGLTLILVVRPLAGMLAMIGSAQPWRERALLSFLGIRGVGTVYYIAYGINHGEFGDSERLWGMVGFIIVSSILIHGISATPLMRRLNKARLARPAPAVH